MNRNKIAEASETAQRRPANLTRPGRSASGQGLKIRAISEPRLSGNGRVDRPLRKLRFHNVPSANGPGRARMSRRCGRPRLDRWRASKPMGDGSQSTHSCRSCPGREGMRRRATIGSTEGLRRRILQSHSFGPRANSPMPLLLLASSRGSLKRPYSTCEAGLTHAVDPKIIDCKKASSQNAITGKAGQRRLGHRGHIEDVEVRPAKHHARHFLDGHIDDALDPSVRRIRTTLPS